MGDVGEFLRELPSKVVEYEEIINSVRLFKYTCSKRFDVIQLEQLRQRIEAEELPLLGKLWDATKLMDRFVKHHGSNYNIQPTISALHKFAPLFEDKDIFGTPKIINLVKSELKALPKDKYHWGTFNRMFELEKLLLDKSKKLKPQPIKHTTTGFLTALSGKNKMIILVVLVVAISGGFFTPWAGTNKDSTTNTVKSYDIKNNVFYFDSNRGSKGILFNLDGISAEDVPHHENFARNGNILEGTNGTQVYINDNNLIAFLNNLKNEYASKQVLPTQQEQKTPLSLAEGYFSEGKTFYDQKEYTKAIEKFIQAINLNPQKSDYYTWIGDANRRLDNCDEAVKHYNSAIGLNSKDEWAWNGLGGCYNIKNMKKEACDSWKKGAELGNTASINNLKKYCN